VRNLITENIRGIREARDKQPHQIEVMERSFKKKVEKADRLEHWQFGLLIAGAGLYVVWHVWEMYLRSAALNATTSLRRFATICRY
jgi:hypothetical protein